MKRQLALTLSLLPLLLLAQSRIAVYDGAQVLNALPDKARAEARLKTTSERLQAEYAMLQNDFDRKFAEYQSVATDSDTPASIRDRRMQEVQESDKRIQAYQQQAAAELKQQEERLMLPIRAAISAAVAEVGDEAGYDIIIDLSKTAVDYIGARVTNITEQVKRKLGI